jgi:hypothetical protein
MQTTLKTEVQKDKAKLKRDKKKLNKAQKLTRINNKSVRIKTNPITLKMNQDQEMMKAYSNLKNQNLKYLTNLLNPWSAINAKLPQIGNQSSNTAKVKTYFTITSNATGFLVLYFNPRFVQQTGTTNTAFLFNNAATLDGVSLLSPTTWTGGQAAPITPANTVLKWRLVSSGMKVVPKVSALNYVATAISCLDYADTTTVLAGSTLNPIPSTINQYLVYNNTINGNGALKFDLSNPGQAIYYNWFPSDPLSDIYIDAGELIADNFGHEAGGSPKFVLSLQDLPPSSKVDVEIVWNIEYLANPVAKPWLGYSPTMVSNRAITALRESTIIENISYSPDGMFRPPSGVKMVSA